MSPEPQSLPDFTHGPFLLAASICEHVLEEKDGVKSAIRMIDQFNRSAIGTNPPPIMEPFQRQFGLLLRLKAGAARGSHQLEVRVRKPTQEAGAVEPAIIQPVHFPGPDDAGIDLVVNMIMTFDEEGPWWFDVYFDQQRMVRIPLRIVYFRQPITRGGVPGIQGGV